MTFKNVPLGPDFGVELSGFDARELDDEKIDAFRKAFHTHSLVMIRDMELSEDQQVALTETLGEVSFSSPVMKHGGLKKFSLVSNQHEEGHLRDGELLFHSDHMFFERPLRAIALYALAAPQVGGETVFINANAAYHRLPRPLQERIAPLRARHMASYGTFKGDSRPSFDTDSKVKSAIHPVVWPHPESGVPILFASRLLTESIVGLPPAESEALLEELFAYLENEDFAYVHKWRTHDYLVWDNRQLQHARRTFDPSEKRALRRVPIADLVTA